MEKAQQSWLWTLSCSWTNIFLYVILSIIQHAGALRMAANKSKKKIKNRLYTYLRMSGCNESSYSWRCSSVQVCLVVAKRTFKIPAQNYSLKWETAKFSPQHKLHSIRKLQPFLIELPRSNTKYKNIGRKSKVLHGECDIGLLNSWCLNNLLILCV